MNNFLGLVLVASSVGAIANMPGPAIAQIIPDGTLPQNTIVTTDVNRWKIEGGTLAGGNLFHSFSEFAVPTGETAFFNNSPQVRNILFRVTGGKISHIDGLIRTNGGANLFAINPRGIVFGPNARLNIGGSFLGSTADSIAFPEGREFSATNPENQLLTVNIPIGLNFRGDNGKIEVQGQGNSLIFNPQTLQLLRESPPVGLEVLPGKTLALVGGQVEMSGGTAIAPGGRIEIGTVTDGMVRLSTTADGFELDYAGANNFGYLNLSQAALVDASGRRAGHIRVMGRRVRVSGGAAILSNTQGRESGGSLEVRGSESVEVVGTKADGRFFSALLTLVQPEATGDGGNMTIATGRLRVADGAQIATDTYSRSSAGDLRVQATDVELAGTTPDGFLGSGLRTDVQIGGTGDGGNLTVTTERLRLLDGGQLSSANFGPGMGGELTVEAGEIEAIGNGEIRGLLNSTLLSAVSGIYTSALPGSTGNGGTLNITAGRLLVANGARIEGRTFGAGDAGQIMVRATEVIVTSENSPVISSLSSSVGPDSRGNAGTLIISTERLTVADGAEVSVSSRELGSAGNLIVSSDGIRLDGGRLSAETVEGNQANITIAANDIQLRRGSDITTNATGKGTGGNITIDTDTLVALENSQITANAIEGNGGQIAIATRGLFLSPDSEITATSRFGIDGTVEILHRETNPGRGLIPLPQNVVDAADLIGQNFCDRAKNSSFYIVGRGGLPANPGDFLSSGGIPVSLVDPVPASAGETRSSGSSETETPLSPEAIVPARGWVMLPDGRVQLVAYQTPDTTPRDDLPKDSDCHTMN